MMIITWIFQFLVVVVDENQENVIWLQLSLAQVDIKSSNLPVTPADIQEAASCANQSDFSITVRLNSGWLI